MKALIAAGILLVPLSTRAAERVAVLVFEDDPVSCGQRQHRVEERLRSLKLAALPAEVIAGKLLAAPQPSIAGEKARKELATVAELYWKDEIDAAASKLFEVEALVRAMGERPEVDPVLLDLWRVAFSLARDDQQAARDHGKAVLSRAPDLDVDLAVFRPSVKKLIESLRMTMPKAIVVNLTGPSGARFWVDGRPSRARVLVQPGRHRLTASSVGFRDVELFFDANTDLTIPIEMPLAPPTSAETSLRRLGEGAELSREDRGTLWELLFRANADVLVVVRVEHSLTGRVFRKGTAGRLSAPFPATSSGEAEFAAWVMQELSRPPERRDVTTSPPRALAVEMFMQIDGLLASRDWRVDSKDGGRFDGEWSGGGSRLTLSASRAPVFADVSVAGTEFDLRRERIRLGDGNAIAVGGGSTWSARVRSGWQLGTRTANIAPFAGIAFEQHVADELRDAEGDLGLLPSWQRWGPELGARLQIQVGRSRGGLEASAPLLTSWRMESAHQFGREAGTSPGLAWTIYADAEVMTAWHVGVALAGRRQTMRFRGRGTAPVEPVLEDARCLEDAREFRLSIQRRFR